MKLVTLIVEREYSKEAVRVYARLGAVYFLHALSPSKRKQVMQEINILVVRLSRNIRQLTIAPLMAEAILRISEERSVSSLFN